MKQMVLSLWKHMEDWKRLVRFHSIYHPHKSKAKVQVWQVISKTDHLFSIDVK